jgi:hypothetical protein
MYTPISPVLRFFTWATSGPSRLAPVGRVALSGEESGALAFGAWGARPFENAGTALTRPTPTTAREPFRRSPRRLTFSISHPLLAVNLTAEI